MPRISPRPVADWPPAMEEVLAAFRPPVTDELPETPPDECRDPGNLVGTFARYPVLAKAYLTFNGHVLFHSSLSSRQRELVVLRVAYRTKCEYEWAQHVRVGAHAGLTSEEVGWIVDGPGRAEWDAPERFLLRAVDELLDATAVSEATWAELARHLDEDQLMDLVFTVGAYQTLAMALRSFGIEPEPELVPNLPGTTGAWDRYGRPPSEGKT